MEFAAGALHGVKVVDLTTVIMGPFATVTLADLGADVIKVENLVGDMNRSVGTRRNEGMSALALNLQRGKRSIAVDLNNKQGREVLDDLIRDADVLVTNLRPRSRAKLGITSERLSEINSRLILCTAQAYGSDTERRDEPAYDDIVQAASGWSRLSELIDGEPRFAPTVIADKVCGLYIVIAILAAVVEQRRTGIGQAVDVPMVDSMIGFNLVEHLAGHTFDPPEGGLGWTRVLTPERTPHRSADGWICIMPYSLANWNHFFALAGREDLVGDSRYLDLTDRYRRMGELLAIVREAAVTRTTAEWLKVCRQYGIPAAEALDLATAHKDDYVLRQHLLTRRDHPTEGSYYATRTPVNLSRTPVGFTRHAPQIGKDTLDILTSLGYQVDHIEELRTAGIIATHEDVSTAAEEAITA